LVCGKNLWEVWKCDLEKLYSAKAELNGHLGWEFRRPE
jgi:hypothetical protein